MTAHQHCWKEIYKYVDVRCITVTSCFTTQEEASCAVRSL